MLILSITSRVKISMHVYVYILCLNERMIVSGILFLVFVLFRFLLLLLLFVFCLWCFCVLFMTYGVCVCLYILTHICYTSKYAFSPSSSSSLHCVMVAVFICTGTYLYSCYNGFFVCLFRKRSCSMMLITQARWMHVSFAQPLLLMVCLLCSLEMHVFR